MLILGWFFASFFVAFVFGAARTIGFWGSFLISLLLSPIVGFIITLLSETKSKAADRKKMLDLQEQNNKLLQELKNK
jgi:hypothetical protein